MSKIIYVQPLLERLYTI